MANQHDFTTINAEQLFLSPELIHLLRWLVEHQTETLKKIIQKAVQQNFKIEQTHNNDPMTEYSRDSNDDITEFFLVLEELLGEVLAEKLAQKARQNKLWMTADQIDCTSCDDATVRSCIESAIEVIETTPLAQPKEIFLQELLKQWQPAENSIIN